MCSIENMKVFRRNDPAPLRQQSSLMSLLLADQHDQHAAPASPGHTQPHEGVLRLQTPPAASCSPEVSARPQTASYFSFDADDQGEQCGSGQYATRRRATEESAGMGSLYGQVHGNEGEADWPDRARTAPPSHAAGSSARLGLTPPQLDRHEWQPSQFEQHQQQQLEQLEQEQEDLWQQQQEQQWMLDQKRRRIQQQQQQHLQRHQVAPPASIHGHTSRFEHLTNRSSSSHAAGKPSRRGELSYGLGGRALVAPCNAATDSTQVSAVLHDVTASLRPRDEPPQPRCSPSGKVQENKAPPDMQRYEQALERQLSTPYAGARSTRRSRECTNPLVDPASYWSDAPMTTTSRAAFALAHAAPQPQPQPPPPPPPHESLPPPQQPSPLQSQQPPPSAGETKRTSFGHAFVHPSGRTFVRAGQMAEAAGAVRQSTHRFVGAHTSAPFGVTPVDTDVGRMSYRTSSEAGHGEMSWNDAAPASLAGRIAQRRLRSHLQGEGMASALSITG